MKQTQLCIMDNGKTTYSRDDEVENSRLIRGYEMSSELELRMQNDRRLMIEEKQRTMSNL